MIITLDEILAVNLKVPDVALRKIKEVLYWSNRKDTKARVDSVMDRVNNNNEWYLIQTEFIFFKDGLGNCHFFGDNKIVKKFVINIEDKKYKKLPFDYKKNRDILENMKDGYSFVWVGKKESILKTLLPVKKIIKEFIWQEKE